MTEPEIAAEYVVASASGAEGVNVALFVAASYETIPATGLPEPSVKVNVADVNVAGFMDRENVAVIEPVGAPVAPSVGDVAVTVGGGGAGAAVVNDHVRAEPSATPSADFTVPASVAVYTVDGAKADAGVKTAWLVEPLYETLPATRFPPPSRTVNVARG